ncbi:hypothetical protein LTR40_014601, partial [Exophiala xenobiotica]
MEGKVFVVTGAGSGIGRATAIRLAELGAAGIAISDIDQAGLEETRASCNKYPARITTTKVDVSNAQQVDSWVKDTVSLFGKLDGAANIAGIA